MSSKVSNTAAAATLDACDAEADVAALLAEVDASPALVVAMPA